LGSETLRDPSLIRELHNLPGQASCAARLVKNWM
jgi:hypothetical protein